MPKMKTHSASKKRFKKRKNNIKYTKSCRRHLLTKKSTKRKRSLRKPATIHKADEARVLRCLPN